MQVQVCPWLIPWPTVIYTLISFNLQKLGREGCLESREECHKSKNVENHCLCMVHLSYTLSLFSTTLRSKTFKKATKKKARRDLKRSECLSGRLTSVEQKLLGFLNNMPALLINRSQRGSVSSQLYSLGRGKLRHRGEATQPRLMPELGVN